MRYDTVKPAEELGSWDGDTFTFHVPVELTNGAVVKSIDCSEADLPDGITRDDVVTAVGNNIAVLPDDGVV